MTLSLSRRARRTATTLTVLVAAVFALSACAGGAPAPADDPATSADGFGDLTVQLSWIKNEEFAGEYFAEKNGYYADAGFGKVTLVPGPSTGAAELISGTADVAFSDAASIGSVVASEGAPLKIIGATFQKNPFTVLSLAGGADIATPADLIGKRIGVQDSNTALFRALLAANDIDLSELEIVPVQYDPAPLLNGEVDGFIAYITNEAITVEMGGTATTNLTFADNGLPFVAETFTVTDDAIANDREKLKAFLVAEIKGWTDAVADPEEGALLAVEEFGVDLNLDPAKTLAGARAQNELISTDETVEHGLFTVSDSLLKKTLKSLAGAGITIESADLFDLSLLAEVYQENPDLVAYVR